MERTEKGPHLPRSQQMLQRDGAERQGPRGGPRTQPRGPWPVPGGRFHVSPMGYGASEVPKLTRDRGDVLPAQAPIRWGSVPSHPCPQLPLSLCMRPQHTGEWEAFPENHLDKPAHHCVEEAAAALSSTGLCSRQAPAVPRVPALLATWSLCPRQVRLP